MDKNTIKSQIDRLLTLDEACKVLGITRMTLYRMRKTSQLKDVRIGGRVFIKPEDINALIEDQVAA